MAAAVGSLIMRRTLRPAMTPASFVALALRIIEIRRHRDDRILHLAAEIRLRSRLHLLENGRRDLLGLEALRLALVLDLDNRLLAAPSSTLNGQCFMSLWTSESLKRRPIRRFASNTVFAGLDAATPFAASPTRRSSSVNDTYEGVVRFPWSFAIISTRSFCQTPTQEYVVPRSIPIAGMSFI
jgi:hypothetical protein